MEGAKQKILIVDDDKFLLDMYALKFSQNDFEVHTAGNGVEAVEKLKGGLAPQIILMDLIMPDMNGFEMLEKIGTEKLAPQAAKIVLSNKSQQEDMDKAKSLGASGYIVKANYTPLEVIGEVKKVLEANKQPV